MPRATDTAHRHVPILRQTSPFRRELFVRYPAAGTCTGRFAVARVDQIETTAP